MKRINITISEAALKYADKLIKQNPYFDNLSQMIRMLILNAALSEKLISTQIGTPMNAEEVLKILRELKKEKIRK